MDETKYEKIEGGFLEALTLMKKGETVYDHHFQEYVLSEFNRLLFVDPKGVFRQTLGRFNELSCRSWYIKKPFDVRQAMRDKPDEWVAAYKNFEGKWFKIGFDSESMNAVVEQLEWDGAPFWQHQRARPSLFKESIPIEDVPEEVTR